MAKFIEARIDAGRLIADCPATGCRGAELVILGEDFICSSCHPEAYAVRWTQGPKGKKDRARFALVPDEEIRGPARDAIKARQASCKVKFPKDLDEIMNILRQRPSAKNMFWNPGDTLEELRALNRENGVPEGR